MINHHPKPVECALCGATDPQHFSFDRCWVLQPASGIGPGSLRWIFAVCNECIDVRKVSFEPHHSWDMANHTGVWVRGAATLADLEKRVEQLEKDS